MDFPSLKPSETFNRGGCSQDTWSLCPPGLIGKMSRFGPTVLCGGGGGQGSRGIEGMNRTGTDQGLGGRSICNCRPSVSGREPRA